MCFNFWILQYRSHRKNLEKGKRDIVVVSPDGGGIKRAENFKIQLEKEGIEADFAVMIKKRFKANEVESSQLVGDVQGKTVIIIDDICDTGGTLVAAAKELQEKGANRVYAFITHPIFSSDALVKIENSMFEKVFVTDSLPLPHKDSAKDFKKIQIISMAPTLANIIQKMCRGESLAPVCR